MLVQSVCGPLWTSVDNGNLENVSGEFFPVDLCESLWNSVDLCGQGEPTKNVFLFGGHLSCGPLWTTVDHCGPLRPLWTSVDLCGQCEPAWLHYTERRGLAGIIPSLKVTLLRSKRK